MITPQLEKLILCGKAFFKTFVAGGEKHTLTFGEDRFIIITDITYFPMNIVGNGDNIENNNTQVAIYGERGYNHFIFRNFLISYDFTDPERGFTRVKDFVGPVTINTYLLHEQQVGFSFGNAPYFKNINSGVANADNPAYAPPLEYGKDGQPGALPTITTMTAINAGSIQDNFTTRPIAGNIESQQLFFPFDSFSGFSENIDFSFEYPLLHVNYVEVLGNPNNIQI